MCPPANRSAGSTASVAQTRNDARIYAPAARNPGDVKSLPLAYDRDLQEDKRPAFAARADVRGALAALTVLMRDLSFDRDRLAGACADPLLRATDAAERLVRSAFLSATRTKRSPLECGTDRSWRHLQQRGSETWRARSTPRRRDGREGSA